MTHKIEPIADTIPAACIRMGISRSTLYLEIAAGNIRAVKVRRRTLIPRAEQDDWLAALPLNATAQRAL